MAGLFLALLDYEWCLYADLDRGLSSKAIEHDYEWNGSVA